MKLRKNRPTRGQEGQALATFSPEELGTERTGEVRRKRRYPWTILASLLLHGVAFASLGLAPGSDSAKPRKTEVSFEVVNQPAPPAPEPEPPKPEPPKPELAKPKLASTKVATAPAPPPAEPPPTAPAGVTLAVDGSGHGFAVALGRGGELEPTEQRIPREVVPAPKEVAAPAVRSGGPRLVAPGDLSQRPAPPPALGAALERNYPGDARRRGSSGIAKVRARIDPDGTVRRVTLLEESAAGFGAACSRTLNGSRWAAPKDRAGRSVATEIRYTCRFVVQP